MTGFNADNSKFLYQKYFTSSNVSATRLFEFWDVEIDDPNVMDILDGLQVPIFTEPCQTSQIYIQDHESTDISIFPVVTKIYSKMDNFSIYVMRNGTEAIFADLQPRIAKERRKAILEEREALGNAIRKIKENNIHNNKNLYNNRTIKNNKQNNINSFNNEDVDPDKDNIHKIPLSSTSVSASSSACTSSSSPASNSIASSSSSSSSSSKNSSLGGLLEGGSYSGCQKCKKVGPCECNQNSKDSQMQRRELLEELVEVSS